MSNERDPELPVHAPYERDIAALPGKRLEVDGRLALTAWQKLRREGDGWPIVIGDDDQLHRVAEQAAGGGDASAANPKEIIEKARSLRHPHDLELKIRSDEQQAEDYLRDLPVEQRRYQVIEVRPDGTHSPRWQDPLEQAPREPPIGEWPAEAIKSVGLSVATGFVERNGHLYSEPVAKANLLVLPTADWTETPALLRWGGWNECPAPEYHIAAFRSWRDRYGAELVGMSADALNLRVARRPGSRDEALSLAREFFVYCPDSIEQGAQTLSQLAATLMADEWWYFWWD